MISREVREAHLPFDRNTVFAALADFAAYPGWWPGVSGARILVREGDVTVAELSGSGWGHGVFEFLASGGEEISIEQVDQVGAGRLQAVWTLAEEGPEETHLRLETSRRAWPWQRRRRGRLRRLGSDLLAGLEARCRILGEGERAPERSPWLEIREKAGGELEVLLEGRLYRARPLEGGA